MSSQIQKIVKTSSNPNLIERAFEFAKFAHLGQKRFSGEDYIHHPLGVAEILNEMGLDPATIAAGLLHDLPDDTSISLEEIEKKFGKEISFLVRGVSKLGKLRYPKEKLDIAPIDQRAKKPVDLRVENLRRMFFAMAEDIRVILIKLADRLDNMKTLDFVPKEKQKRIALETLEIFAPLANRLGMGEIKGKLEDLAFPYLYPREFKWLIKKVKDKYETRKKYLKKVKPVLNKILAKEKIKPIDINLRAKHYFSLYQKLLRYEMDLEKIYDLVALRIIVQDIETCYKTLGTIHKYWKPLPGRIKDYIALPKPNGYQSLHTTVFCLDGKITEIQIRTPKMHQEAEYGICAHWARKEGVNFKTQRKKFAWVRQLREWQKEVSDSKEFLDSLKLDFFKNRIFVFTPKGDVIDLPEEATPIDFAYAVHTEIGNHCAGAKVNGKMVSLSDCLKNGDMVEIITNKSKHPSRAWLEFVKTSLARSQIKKYFKQELKIEKTAEKKTLVPIKEKKEIGFSKIQIKTRKKSNLVSLAGKTGILINFAKCCFPQPLDKIAAFITKNRGASIHKINCENLKKVQKKWPQKIIEAQWLGEKKIAYPINLKIKAVDRIGLFRDISSTISNLGINILSCKAQSSSPEKFATFEAKVEISSWKELNKLLNQLKKIKQVKSIEKF